MQQSKFEATIQVGLFGDTAITHLSEQNDPENPQLVSRDIKLLGSTDWLDEIKPKNTTLGPGTYTITGTGSFDDVNTTYTDIVITPA